MIKLIKRTLFYSGCFVFIIQMVLPTVAVKSPKEVVKGAVKTTKCKDGEKVSDVKFPKIAERCHAANGKVTGCTSRCLLSNSGYVSKDYKRFLSDSKLAKNMVKLQGLTEKTAKKYVVEVKKANCRAKMPKPNECPKFDTLMQCLSVAFRKAC